MGVRPRPGHPGRPSLQRLDEKDFQLGEAEGDDPYQRIRCPKCGWRPTRDSRWFCSRPRGRYMCGHSWNTFDTRGVCPNCKHQWLHTACLVCSQWSLHEEWYEKGPEQPR